MLHMVLAQIFLQGLEVIAILRLKRFRLFSETAVRSSQYAVCNKQQLQKAARFDSFLCTGIGLRQEPRVYPTKNLIKFL